MHTYRYVIRGQTPCHRLLVKGKRVSVVAAMSTEGIIAYECFTGTLDSSRFFDFVRGTLIAQMHSFDGSSPRSILIMDNCSVHHVQEIQDLAFVGIPLIYLPPYSPDYNPLQEAFSFIKKYLKQHDELLQVLRDPLAVIQQAFTGP